MRHQPWDSMSTRELAREVYGMVTRPEPLSAGDRECIQLLAMRLLHPWVQPVPEACHLTVSDVRQIHRDGF